MTEHQRMSFPLLSTGVPGLDEVLGGGIPEFSFNLITGTPGAGKSTLAHQIIFATASFERPALYFTVMGEPPIKVLRHQQQMSFFDIAKVGQSIHFIDLTELAITQGLGPVLEQIVQQVEALNPRIVVVDSFQAAMRASGAAECDPMNLQVFTQRLAVHLTILQATTFLIGTYLDEGQQNNPVLTIADGVFVLSQSIDRNSVVRKLQVVKSRGHGTMPGLHTFRISQAGLRVFPRASIAVAEQHQARSLGRGTTGVEGLDDLLGGGIPLGDAVLVSGPSGSGKSVLAAQFIAAGARQGEPGVIAVFEEHPSDYVRRALSLGIDLAGLEQAGVLKIIYIRPLDLSPDETLFEIREAVQAIRAKRVVIDSLTGFELALAPTFRTDFRESLYRLVGSLTGTDIMVLMTMEIVQSATDLRLSPYVISFLADNIILLRYVEIAGELRKSLRVIKMRNSDHSSHLWQYEITAQGMIVRESLMGYGISTGTGSSPSSERVEDERRIYPGLTAQELIVLHGLIALQGTSAQPLAQRIGLPEGPILTAALDRLISLRYAIRRDEADGAIYWPVAQAMG
ncbi:AAA family ATPase [Chloroflexales bacterium ZM16-3]|nr:AAA family ATPase [Chloroflexales bacterium ZM16-3]